MLTSQQKFWANFYKINFENLTYLKEDKKCSLDEIAEELGGVKIIQN